MQAIELLKRDDEEERPLTFTEKQSNIIRIAVQNPLLDETEVAEEAGASNPYTRRVLVGAHPDDVESASDPQLAPDEVAMFRSVFEGRVDANEIVDGKRVTSETGDSEVDEFEYGDGEHHIEISASGPLDISVSSDVEAKVTETTETEMEAESDVTDAEIDVTNTEELINEAQRLAEQYGIDFQEALTMLRGQT